MRISRFLVIVRQPINNTTTAKLGGHLHEAMCIFQYFADDGGLTREGM